MKGKNNCRIVSILIPATDTSPEMSFYVPLLDLQKALRNAIDNNLPTITFDVNGKKVNLLTANVKQMVMLAKKQFMSQLIIPANLQKYLHNLSSYTSNLSEEKLSARDEEIEKLWTCLCTERKSNAILVGEHGVGKTTMAMEIVRQINLNECPKQLSKYVVLEIDIVSLLEKGSRFKREVVLRNLFEFVKLNSKKVIFYIDNLIYFKTSPELIQYFMALMKSLNIKLIASITYDDFEKYFMPDEAMMKYLNPILIEEPQIEEIYPMLKTRIEQLQKNYKIKISERMVRFAILTGMTLSSSTSANPENTLDIINFALADAKRKGNKEVLKTNILSYYYIDFKLAKKTNKNEKLITAYHEAGHYLVSKMSKNIKSIKNAFVSILPIEGALGLTASYEDVGQQLTFSKEYYIDEIAICLGGRVGEEVFTHEFSSGAQSDLMSANSMAEKLVLSYGLYDIDGQYQKSFMIGNYIKDFLLTDDLIIKINKKISEIMNEAYKRAETIIKDNKKLLEIIVEKLLEDNILMGDELDEIYDKYSKNLIS